MVSKNKKLFIKIASGSQDSSILFSELTNLTIALGFSERVTGSHHIYYKDGIVEILNFQPDGNQAKPYQVRQLRSIISKYGLELTENE